ncbi:hypothetical protein Pelo_4796 [Pelomyxa schiedti]|nr:hypothetical protein Pelo_4796 [Pelomyxa schiedti]
MGNNQGTVTPQGTNIQETNIAQSKSCCILFQPRIAPYSLLVEILLRACGFASVHRHVVLSPPWSPPSSPSPCPPSSPIVPLPRIDLFVFLATSDDGYCLDEEWHNLISGQPLAPRLIILVMPGVTHPEVRSEDDTPPIFNAAIPAVLGVDARAGAETEVVTLKVFCEIAELLARPDGCLSWLSALGGRSSEGVAAWFVAFCVQTLDEALLLARDVPVYYYITPTRRKVSDRDLPLISEMLGARGAPIVRHSVNFEELGLGWLPALDNGELYLRDSTYKYEDVRDEFLDIIEAFYITIAMAFKNDNGTPPLSADSSLQTRSPTKIETPKPTNLPPKPPPNDHQSTANSQGKASAPQQPVFCLSTANVDQVCVWLGSHGLDNDCLNVIRSAKLRGRTLASYTVQQLCSLGIVVGDAEIIAEESFHADQRLGVTSCTIAKAIEGHQYSPELNYKCFAFVVGNESYGGQFSLKNTITDAECVSAFLRTKCNFEVACHLNIPNIEEFTSNLEKFKATLKEQKKARNKVASIFYFAGHGRQIKGHNFLLMTSDDVAFTEPGFNVMKYKAPMLGVVLEEIKKQSDLTTCVLMKKKTHTERTCTAHPELIHVIESRSFFTGCFLEVAEKARPGTPFGDIIDDTILMVQTQSKGTQSPWLSKSVGARFSLF